MIIISYITSIIYWIACIWLGVNIFNRAIKASLENMSGGQVDPFSMGAIVWSGIFLGVAANAAVACVMFISGLGEFLRIAPFFLN